MIYPSVLDSTAAPYDVPGVEVVRSAKRLSVLVSVRLRVRIGSVHILRGSSHTITGSRRMQFILFVSFLVVLASSQPLQRIKTDS